jgi:integrase
MTRLDRGTASPADAAFSLDALRDAWFQALDPRPGRRLSAARRGRARQQLAVLKQVAHMTGRDALDDEVAVVIDPGSDCVPVRAGSMDDLAPELVAAGYPFTTRQQILETWRQFERWLISERAPGPRPASRPPVSLSQSEIVRMLEAARSPGPRRPAAWPARDRAIVAVMLAAGPRSSELVSLQTSDVVWAVPALILGAAEAPRRRQLPVSEAVMKADLDAALTATSA